MAHGGPSAVIPRYQKILFGLLLAASVAMCVTLWHLRQRAHERLIAGEDSAPTSAPQIAPSEQATLLVANDSDGSLLTQFLSLPLPADPGARARAVLGRLLDLYAAPNSTHPVPGGAASVAQVFLLPLPGANSGAGGSATAGSSAGGSDGKQPELAVVNLTGNFAAGHPSGLETETLTVLSLCGT